MTVYLLLPPIESGRRSEGLREGEDAEEHEITHAVNLKKAVMVSSECLRLSAWRRNDCLKKLEVEIGKVMGIAETSGLSSLGYLVKTTDAGMLQRALDALDKNKSGTNLIDSRPRLLLANRRVTIS